MPRSGVEEFKMPSSKRWGQGNVYRLLPVRCKSPSPAIGVHRPTPRRTYRAASSLFMQAVTADHPAPAPNVPGNYANSSGLLVERTEIVKSNG
jgi:hypothetical protein